MGNLCHGTAVDRTEVEVVKETQVLSSPSTTKQNTMYAVDRKIFDIKWQDWPQNVIGKLYHHGVGQGTGVLIRNNLVLTCAHVVWNDEKNAIARPNDLLFEVPDETRTGKTVALHIAKVYCPAEYHGSDEQKSSFDFALLVLHEKYNSKLFYEIELFGQDHDKTAIRITGFPEDGKGTLCESAGKILWSDRMAGNVWNYNIDTNPGLSGAPIHYHNKDNQLSVIGVHILGGGPPGEGIPNKGLMFTEEIFNTLKRWINENPSTLENNRNHRNTVSKDLRGSSFRNPNQNRNKYKNQDLSNNEFSQPHQRPVTNTEDDAYYQGQDYEQSYHQDGAYHQEQDYEQSYHQDGAYYQEQDYEQSYNQDGAYYQGRDYEQSYHQDGVYYQGQDYDKAGDYSQTQNHYQRHYY